MHDHNHAHTRAWRVLRFLLPRTFRERFGEDFRLAHMERASHRGQSNVASLRSLVGDVIVTAFQMRAAQLRSALAAIAAVSLAIVAASIVPVKRAARIDPASALRFD